MDRNNQFLEDAQMMGRMELKRPTLQTCIHKNGKKKREVEHLETVKQVKQLLLVDC